MDPETPQPFVASPPSGDKPRNRRIFLTLLAIIAIATAAVALGYQRWIAVPESPVLNVLSQMPADAATVIYIDADALRQSPFLAELYKWAPQPAAEADYTHFVQATGFSYERDLERVGIALSRRGQDTTLFAIADGHFDQKKIAAYAALSGTRVSRQGHELFSVPVSGENRHVAFTFVRRDRIALTNGADIDSASSPPMQTTSDAQTWRERFRRLAGSPIFAVIRQDGAAAVSLPSQGPGGFQSPQISALLSELQWITVAGKPDGDRLRIILEGEGSPQINTRQMTDVLNGLLVFAQAGLNDPKLRQQLDPQVREAYLEVLKSADVSQLDRGDSKSVRLIFDVTPKLLDSARTAVPAAPAPAPTKPFPNKRTFRN